jgi:hypothetical protein
LIFEYLSQNGGNKKLQLFLTDLCNAKIDWKETLKNNYSFSVSNLNKNMKEYFLNKKTDYEAQYSKWKVRK